MLDIMWIISSMCLTFCVETELILFFSSYVIAETDKSDITTHFSTRRKVSFFSDDVCLIGFLTSLDRIIIFLYFLMLRSAFTASGMRIIYIQVYGNISC